MGFPPVSDLGRLVIFVNKRWLLTEEIGSCMLTAHTTGLPKHAHIRLVHTLQLAHGQRDFHLVATLRRGDVSKANGPLRLPYHANGIPPSRVLDFQSRFGVTSAFLRAIRQLVDSTHQLHRRNTGHGAEATAQSPSNQTTALVSVPCHACLHEITSPPSSRAAICIGGLRANYCAVVNHLVHARRLTFTPTLASRPLRLTFNMRNEGGYAAAANSACAVDLRFMDEEIEGDADKQGLSVRAHGQYRAACLLGCQLSYFANLW